MNTLYRIWNITLNKWVEDEDGGIAQYLNPDDAKAAKEWFTVLSKSNFTKKFRNNQFEVREHERI